MNPAQKRGPVAMDHEQCPEFMQAGTEEEAPAPMVDPSAVAEGAAGVVAPQEEASASSAASQVQPRCESPSWPIHVCRAGTCEE